MFIEKEDYENMLSELLDPELDHSRRGEILQTFREDKQALTVAHNELNESKAKLEKDNNDLILSNSKLFRQLGHVTDSSEEQEEEKEKEFSETVTIEEISKNAELF